MDEFNLLEERWIEVLCDNGSIENLSVQELLLNADIISEIIDSSPILRCGTYRFLIAFISDMCEISSASDVISLLSQKKFSRSAIESYCQKYYRKFYLFSDTDPFYQNPNLIGAKKTTSIAKLFHQLPAGRNPLFFNYNRFAEDDHAICPEICARSLVAQSAFAIGFGMSHRNSEGKRVDYKSSVNGNPPWYFLLLGKNLFETLLFNCVGIDQQKTINSSNGSVIWKNDDIDYEASFTSDSVSTLQGLTWLPRQILLIPEYREDGICTYTGKKSQVLVSKMKYFQGFFFEGTFIDPHVCYIVPKKKEKDVKVKGKVKDFISLKPDINKSFIQSILPILLAYYEDTDKDIIVPITFNQFSQMQRESLFQNLNLDICAIGLTTEKGKGAKYLKWHSESLVIPSNIYLNQNKRSIFSKSIRLAIEINEILRKSIYYIDKNSVDRLILVFWNDLEVFFLNNFVPSLSSATQESDIQQIFSDWKRYLYRTGKCIVDGEISKRNYSFESLREILNTFRFYKNSSRKILFSKTSKEVRPDDVKQ